MASLLALPNEVILEIISYIRPRPPVSLRRRPFNLWVQTIAKQDFVAFANAKQLNSAVLTCRRLHNLLNPVLYENIPLLRKQPWTKKLLRSFEENPALCAHTKHASVDASKAASGKDVYPLFFSLPALRTLTLYCYDAWAAAEWDDDHRRGQHHMRTSPVTELRLVCCGVRDAALAEMLGFPRALDTLWYDVGPGEQDARLVGEDQPPRVTCAAVERALAVQADSLRALVMTRNRPCREAPRYGTELDLRGFAALRTLSIHHVFLVASSPKPGARAHVPLGLEELEIFYDDMDYLNTLERQVRWPVWLVDLLEQWKPGEEGSELVLASALKRIRTIVIEWFPCYEPSEESGQEESESDLDESDAGRLDENRVAGAPYSIRPAPKDLTRVFREANVSFSIFLHEKRRHSFKVENGQGLLNDWKVTWTRST